MEERRSGLTRTRRHQAVCPGLGWFSGSRDKRSGLRLRMQSAPNLFCRRSGSLRHSMERCRTGQRGGIDKPLPSYGGPRVRIPPPSQQRVSLSTASAFEGREPRLSARVCAAGLATRSAETRRAFQFRANLRQYLCRAIFQYRSAADVVGENATLIPTKSGLPRFNVPADLRIRIGLRQSEHGALIVPIERQT